ncbi:LysM peptidoglycan-binding domain-containing protein [Paracoccus alkanivorans]|uniref:LysM peptidoglycan-binding domain-containing protein n=1 Tax=Paracoccus alkanivorans TaxID=2116655 RepID=A0A3M0M2J6_9RHOB|nr:LysM peptidoglycan-binding domain-containing protein [Paracoccus alkanivorans]RMC31992.1 LysM peptidoglycan-binding domain-containing protein [Paracoccus alkanivorans]
MRVNFRLLAGAAGTIALLASCGPNGFDPDLRGWFPGALNTADAAAKAPPRPRPDSRGLITFSDYQVVVAQSGDTPASIASRLGLSAEELARHNALPANGTLHGGAVLVLPRRVAGGTPVAGGISSSTGQVTDPFAGQGVAKPNVPGMDSEKAQSQPTATAGQQPRQHQVASGETAWSIARKYGVTVQDLATWNGLPSNMALRVGQRLMIPVAGQAAPNPTAVTTAPGSGSPTPRPPSAAQPLPDEETAPASEPGPEAETPDLGATRTEASSGGRFSMPASGSIIRVYEKGRNDGIDISAPSGTDVKAAGSGTVAAVTRDTSGVPIVVVRHDDGLMTVYTGMDDLSVAKGDSVSSGQAIGQSGASGVVHFEVRRGFESVDPEEYLR